MERFGPGASPCFAFFGAPTPATAELCAQSDTPLALQHGRAMAGPTRLSPTLPQSAVRAGSRNILAERCQRSAGVSVSNSRPAAFSLGPVSEARARQPLPKQSGIRFQHGAGVGLALGQMAHELTQALGFGRRLGSGPPCLTLLSGIPDFRAQRLARAATLRIGVESVRIEVLTQPLSHLGVAFDEVRVGVALAATDVADLALN
jgi:hypothetical protein